MCWILFFNIVTLIKLQRCHCVVQLWLLTTPVIFLISNKNHLASNPAGTYGGKFHYFVQKKVNISMAAYEKQ